MKLSEIISIANALNAIAAKPIPAKTAYLIAKNIRAVQPHVEAFEAARKKAFDAHATPNEQGRPHIAPDNMDAFAADVMPLLETDEDVVVLPISVNALGAIEIEPGVLAALMPMLTD